MSPEPDRTRPPREPSLARSPAGRRVSHVAAVLVLAFALSTAPALASTATTADPSASVERVGLDEGADLEAWLDETMADHLERHHVPGAAVVVVRDGEVVHAGGYGYADLESRRPVDAAETVFGIGSTSKLLTWTAVMQGVEEGRLDLDRDVNEYLGDSPVRIPRTYSQPITLEHLGTHTAGFEAVYGGTVVDDPSAIRPLGETLAANRPARVRPPGEFVAYSNYGTALAGHVVAERYGVSFTEHVDRRILAPLDMGNSSYEQPLPPGLQSRLATGYAYEGGTFSPRPVQYWGMPPQGGAMHATATDMGRFMLAHLGEGTLDGERVLEAATVREMHRQHFANAPGVPESNGMAYGFVEMDRNGERIVGHWGTTAQFMSLLALVPADDTGLFVVYNSPGGAAARFELLEAFVDRYYPGPETPTLSPPPGATERAARLAGDYRTLAVSHSTWHRVLGVTETVTVRATDDGTLTTEPFGGTAREWVERRPGVYEAIEGDEALVFRVDGDGRGTHLFFSSIGSRTYERLPWQESLAVTLGILLGGVGAFVSALLLWVGGPLWRRLRAGRHPNDRERGSRALLGAVSLLWLAVAAALLLALLNFDAEVASPSLTLRVGLALPYLGLVGTLGAAVAAGLAWREAYWTTPVRVHYSLVVVAALLFAWQLSYLGILPR